MKFAPKTEKEISEANLMPIGEYDFEVSSSTNKTSSKGNDMIELKLHVFETDGSPRIVFDYLLEAMAFKLRHAADACGLIDKYETGSLDAQDFLGKTGKCKIGIQKDKNGQHPDKNVIADYIKRSAQTVPVKESVATGAMPIDDEIPF